MISRKEVARTAIHNQNKIREQELKKQLEAKKAKEQQEPEERE